MPEMMNIQFTFTFALNEIFFYKKGLNAKTSPGIWVSCKNPPLGFNFFL